MRRFSSRPLVSCYPRKGYETLKPAVAVLLSVYRYDRYDWFTESVDSILNQSYGKTNIRIYLGIDGKIDRDIDNFVEEHGDLFYVIVRTGRWFGKPKTVNMIIKQLGDEEFVFKMDGDDISFENRFDQQVCFLSKHENVDVVGSAFVTVDESMNELFKRSFPEDTDSIRRYICMANPLANPTVCFRRRVFERVGGYPENYRFNEELAMWFLCMKEGFTLSNIREPLLYLRVTGEFYKRRRRASVSELAVYLKGIWTLYGLSYKLLFPFLRFMFRWMPLPVVRFMYSRNLEKLLYPFK
jgi:hypothetical protein